jgi:hypothetical protein
MTKRFRRVASAAFIAALLPIGVPTAQAIQCSNARPSDTHGRWWSWRLIDGRKCWYEGKSMISKTSLRWSPEQASAQPKPDRKPKDVLTVKPTDHLDAQASVPDDSFEARWRARALNY